MDDPGRTLMEPPPAGTHEPDVRCTDPLRPTARRAATPMRIGRHLAGLAGSVALIAILFPRLIGAGWERVASSVTVIPIPLLILLVATWAAGAASRTITFSAALPGLSHRRALMLGLTGGAVAHVLPLGGAAGIALNERMTRHWGFSRTAFAASIVLTHAGDIIARMFLPLLLIPLVLGGVALGGQVMHVVTVAGVALTLVGGVTALLMFGPVLPRLVRRLDDGPRRPVHRLRHRLSDALRACEGVRRRSADVAATRWHRLGTGVVLSTASLFALLLLSLNVSGARVPVGIVFLAFCAERLLTLLGLTPGAIGFVEVGLAGVLMLAPTAYGPGVAAGILLYRLLTFGIEVPVGGVLLGLWFWRRGAHRRIARHPGPVGAVV